MQPALDLSPISASSPGRTVEPHDAVAHAQPGALEHRADSARQPLAEPHRQAPAMRPFELHRPVHSCASCWSGNRSRPKLDDSACAMITRPARIDRDPIAVQRHLDPAVGAEAGVRLPRDVGQQAGGEAQPAHRRRVVEQRRDPIVEQVAVLAEAVLAAAGLARCLDQRVDAPQAGFELPNRAGPRGCRRSTRRARRLELDRREARASSPPPASVARRAGAAAFASLGSG